MRTPINDRYFLVKRCPYASSPQPEKAIWDAQHHCVSENARVDHVPSVAEKAGEAVIKHQLKREHWGVLNHAFVKLNCYGFPHSVVSQITRHQDSHFLVQSMRYTGERLMKADFGDIERLFYLRPAGFYRDRNGVSFEYSDYDRETHKFHLYQSLTRYQNCIKKGMPLEQARGLLSYDFRQDFVISGTVEACFHWLDQRTKENAQLEIYSLAWMVLEELQEWSPTFFNWYLENRAGKSRLAP